jgi:hypothetical protein
MLALQEPRGVDAGHADVRGMTISCQTWGKEWADPALEQELVDLKGLGANWIAIHPYGWIQNDGRVDVRPPLDPAAPPEWIKRPIEAAHEHGMAICVKPQIGYWGSRFSWPGEVEFAAEAERARFFADYRA